jgi:hypothetical protein
MNYEEKVIMIRAIARFLKSKKILDKFCYNVKAYRRLDLDPKTPLKIRTITILSGSLDRLFRNSNIWRKKDTLEEFIVSCYSAFAWDETPEGSRFWNDIEWEWRSYVADNKDFELKKLFGA